MRTTIVPVRLLAHQMARNLIPEGEIMSGRSQSVSPVQAYISMFAGPVIIVLIILLVIPIGVQAFGTAMDSNDRAVETVYVGGVLQNGNAAVFQVPWGSQGGYKLDQQVQIGPFKLTVVMVAESDDSPASISSLQYHPDEEKTLGDWFTDQLPELKKAQDVTEPRLLAWWLASATP